MARPAARVLTLLELLQSGGRPDGGRTRRPARRGRADRPAGGPPDRPRRAGGVGARPLRRVPARLRVSPASAHAERRGGARRAARPGRGPPGRADDGDGHGERDGRGQDPAGPAGAARPQARHRARVARLHRPARRVRRPGSSVLLSIADAVRHHRPVSIRYTAADGRRSERTLHPYGLVTHSGRWYVTGADAGIGEDRTFRLDRIADARTLPGSFEPPAGLDPAQRVLSGLATAPYRHQVTLRIQATAEQIRARLPASVASIEVASTGRPRPTRIRRPSAGSASTCGRSGSTGCPRYSPRSTGRSSSSGRTSSAAWSSRSPSGSPPRPAQADDFARLAQEHEGPSRP